MCTQSRAAASTDSTRSGQARRGGRAQAAWLLGVGGRWSVDVASTGRRREPGQRTWAMMAVSAACLMRHDLPPLRHAPRPTHARVMCSPAVAVLRNASPSTHSTNQPSPRLPLPQTRTCARKTASARALSCCSSIHASCTAAPSTPNTQPAHMLGPVMIAARHPPPSSTTSLGTAPSAAAPAPLPAALPPPEVSCASSMGWRPPRITSLAPPPPPSCRRPTWPGLWLGSAAAAPSPSPPPPPREVVAGTAAAAPGVAASWEGGAWSWPSRVGGGWVGAGRTVGRQ